jgi:transglutaminase-like putative cysteine protease
MRRPYTNPVTGKTHYGYQGAPGEIQVQGGNVTFTYPAESAISADGFVTVEYNSKYPGSQFSLRLEKVGDSSLSTSYMLLPGDSSVRIWLRFGPGEYRISLITNYSPQEIFSVTNTCTDTGVGGDPRFLYPSDEIQSDDFRITNLLSDILYGVSNEADKIKIIHDYLVQNTVYDMSCYASGEQRDWKPQDALTVMGTRHHFDPQYEPAGHFFAVCEGYSNTAAALLRAAGIETRYVVSGTIGHAWNEVYTGGSWKFLDVTWDDPMKSSTSWYDNGPSFVRYTYYLLNTLNGVGGDHPGGKVDNTL